MTVLRRARNVLLAFGGDIAGHAVRSGRIAVAMEGIPEWFVSVLGGGRLASAAGQVRYPLAPYLSAELARQYQSLRTAGSFEAMTRLIRAEFEHDRAALSTRQWDLLVVDGRIGTRIAAAELRLPTIYIGSSVYAASENVFSPSVRRLARLESGIVRRISLEVAGIPVGLGPLDDEAVGLHTLGPEDFERLEATRPATDLGSLPPPDAPPFLGDDPTDPMTVLLTQGTTGRASPLTFPSEVAVVEPKPADVMAWVRQGLSADVAAAGIVCCHGGQGTAAESLVGGRPLLLNPINSEQRRVAELAGAYGVGHVNDGDSVTLDDIEAAAALGGAARKLGVDVRLSLIDLPERLRDLGDCAERLRKNFSSG